jgi:small subunit ribosomal protein S21
VIQIKIKRGEPVEKALKRLKKMMDREGTMKQLRAGRYFEKPSEKKRKKAARARSRAMSIARGDRDGRGGREARGGREGGGREGGGREGGGPPRMGY